MPPADRPRAGAVGLCAGAGDAGDRGGAGADGEFRVGPLWAESAPTGVASGRTGVRAIAAIPYRARNRLHRPLRTFPGTQNQRFGTSTSLIFNARAKPSENIVTDTFDVGLARRHIGEGRPAASVRSSPPRGNGRAGRGGSSLASVAVIGVASRPSSSPLPRWPEPWPALRRRWPFRQGSMKSLVRRQCRCPGTQGWLRTERRCTEPASRLDGLESIMRLRDLVVAGIERVETETKSPCGTGLRPFCC